MNQKDYLKKYLSVDKDKKKSKKKKQKNNKGNLRVIDDSFECEQLEPNFEYDEDAPTIAEVTYEADPSGRSCTLPQQRNPTVTKIIESPEMSQDLDSLKGMTVMRRRKIMKSKKITPEEEERNKREAVLQKVVNESHNRWNHGVTQTERLQQKALDDTIEASKAFARHAHDRDMNERLQNVVREEDPMLEYINRKNSSKTTSYMPTYKGSFPPNRFNIKPGYRWDGVDRSSGYEKSYFERQNANKAQEEDMYKWSVEDM